ncbi:MAG TPA: hypothetical protein VG328_07335 [Stellaceae bacterium]|jgi:hypothetical protein|nr:hypothetical protein [Stellaceae bacterium]
MRKLRAVILAFLTFGSSNCFADSVSVADGTFLRTCSFSKGDSVTAVEAFYGIKVSPKSAPAVTPNSPAYQYHFDQFGVWVFFDSDLQISGIRLDPPFAGKIDGIRVGDTLSQVRQIKGAPTNVFQGMPDFDIYKTIQQQKAALAANLPNPASAEQVRRMMQQVAKLDAQAKPSLIQTTAWVYQAGAEKSVRFDIGVEDGKVRRIFTSSCNAK